MPPTMNPGSDDARLRQRQEAFAGTVSAEDEAAFGSAIEQALAEQQAEQGADSNAPPAARRRGLVGRVKDRVAKFFGERYGSGWSKTLARANLALIAAPLPGAHPVGMAGLIIAAEAHRAYKRLTERRAAACAAQPAGADPAAQMAAAGVPAPPGGAAVPAPAAAATGAAPYQPQAVVSHGGYSVPVDRPFAAPAGLPPSSPMARRLEAMHEAAQPPEVRQRKAVTEALAQEADAAEKARDRARALSEAYDSPQGEQLLKRRVQALKDVAAEQARQKRAERVVEVGPVAAGLEGLSEKLGKFQDTLKGIGSVGGHVFAGVAGGIAAVGRAADSGMVIMPTLSASFTMLGQAIGQSFGAELIGVAKWLQNAAAWFRSLDDETKANIVSVAKWTAILSGGAFVLAKIGGLVLGVGKALAGFAAWLSAGAIAFNPWVAGLVAVAAAVGVLTDGFGLLRGKADEAGDAVEGVGRKGPGGVPGAKEREETLQRRHLERLNEEDRRRLEAAPAGTRERTLGQLEREAKDALERAQRRSGEAMPDFSRGMGRARQEYERAQNPALGQAQKLAEQVGELGDRVIPGLGGALGPGTSKDLRRAVTEDTQKFHEALLDMGRMARVPLEQLRQIQIPTVGKGSPEASPFESPEKFKVGERARALKEFQDALASLDVNKDVVAQTSRLKALQEVLKQLGLPTLPLGRAAPGEKGDDKLKRQQDLLYSIRGLPQPTIGTAAEYATQLQIRSLESEATGTADTEILRNALIELGKILGEGNALLKEVRDGIRQDRPTWGLGGVGG